MLVLTLKPRELLQIGNLTLSIESSKGGHYKLHFGETVVWIKPDNEGRFNVRIDADRSILVRRIKEQREEQTRKIKPGKPDSPPPIAFTSADVVRAMRERNAKKIIS